MIAVPVQANRSVAPTLLIEKLHVVFINGPVMFAKDCANGCIKTVRQATQES